MSIKVVIDMKNPNALIAMAQVAKSANNPYDTFCEYIKYCIFINTSEVMTLPEIKAAIEKEFGLYIPRNVLINCLSYIEAAGIISNDNHQVRRIGSFDAEAFDRERTSYRATESAIITSLLQYAQKYDREWSFEYARELLIKTLDRNGLAYGIFLHEEKHSNAPSSSTVEENDFEENLPDDEENATEDATNEPLFTDEFFVGRFVDEILSKDSIEKEYLQKICEGLMLCVGAYQLPSSGSTEVVPHIKGTQFFFDTKLLLRFIGCAGEAAVSAAKELVSLIQSLGGSIYYYPQTLQEMERAFEKAINSLSNGSVPYDDEMRLYAARIKNSIAIVTAKKASLQTELASAGIYLRCHETFTDSERIRFGFDHNDFQQYMRNKLPWDTQVIDNDALAIWETHMRRQGNYNDYCGTSDRLAVFVTTNSRLISVSLKFREDRQNTTAIYGWKQNRLPVITDIRLTCRLWNPAIHSERMSLLYLTANAVAAKRPTKRYINSIRELAIQLSEQVPEYSGISLPAYFDDNVTEAILERTLGKEDSLNMGNFASSIAELSEWKAKEQEEITNQVRTERDTKEAALNQQTQSIIDGAVECNKNNLGITGIILHLILWWPAIVTLLFAGIGSVLSWAIGNWNFIWIALLPMVAKGIEMLFASKIVEKAILKWYIPKAEIQLNKHIERNLRQAEQPYKADIIQRIKEETALWKKCILLLDK